MKRQLYDLTDDPFVVFVNKVGQVLRAEYIPHNIVGGVASQAYILKMLTEKYGRSVEDLIRDNNIRVQDYIRSTDDVDIALDLKEETDIDKIRRINEILPKFNLEAPSPNEESILEFKNERIGASRPKYRVYVNNQGSEDDVIAMNIGRKPEDLHGLDPVWYMEFLNQREKIIIPYLERFADTYTLELRVPKLEHLLASKISKSRAKDLMDNKNLANLAKDTGVELDFVEMSKVLLPKHEDNYNRFLSAEYPSANKYSR